MQQLRRFGIAEARGLAIALQGPLVELLPSSKCVDLQNAQPIVIDIDKLLLELTNCYWNWQMNQVLVDLWFIDIYLFGGHDSENISENIWKHVEVESSQNTLNCLNVNPKTEQDNPLSILFIFFFPSPFHQVVHFFHLPSFSGPFRSRRRTEPPRFWGRWPYVLGLPLATSCCPCAPESWRVEVLGAVFSQLKYESNVSLSSQERMEKKFKTTNPLRLLVSNISEFIWSPESGKLKTPTKSSIKNDGSTSSKGQEIDLSLHDGLSAVVHVSTHPEPQLNHAKSPNKTQAKLGTSALCGRIGNMCIYVCMYTSMHMSIYIYISVNICMLVANE